MHLMSLRFELQREPSAALDIQLYIEGQERSSVLYLKEECEEDVYTGCHVGSRSGVWLWILVEGSQILLPATLLSREAGRCYTDPHDMTRSAYTEWQGILLIEQTSGCWEESNRQVPGGLR
jgi:hypothetical protein